MCMCERAHVQTCACANVHMYKHVHVRTCICTNVCTYIRLRIHVNTHIDTLRQ
ncbi:hypothetical protein LOAG_15083, partial [Loa loa]